MATALGEAEDEKLYGSTPTGRNGAPDADRQAKLVRPLAFDFAEGTAFTFAVPTNTTAEVRLML